MNAVRMLLPILTLVFTVLSAVAYLRKAYDPEPFRVDPNDALRPYPMPVSPTSPSKMLPAPPLPDPDPSQEALERQPASPYELRRYVLQHNDDRELPEPYVRLDEFWLRLGIGSESWRGYDHCKVDLFKISLAGAARQDLLLRLYDDSGWSWGCRYLLFTPSDPEQTKSQQWKFLGYIDIEESRYSPPEHQVVQAGDKRWLAVSSLVAHGSGFDLYSEGLYDITANGLKEVLNFPSSGYLDDYSLDGGPERQFDTNIVNRRHNNGITTLIVQFVISYSYKGTRLWEKTQKAAYKMADCSDEFKLDPDNSDLTEEQLNDIYSNDMALTKEALVNHYHDELEAIARGNSSKRKEWLETFLPGFK